MAEKVKKVEVRINLDFEKLRAARLKKREEYFARKPNKNKSSRLPKLSSTETPFSILGVPENSSVKECEKAFRKIALLNHPDKTTLLILTGEETEETVLEKMKIFEKALDALTEILEKN